MSLSLFGVPDGHKNNGQSKSPCPSVYSPAAALGSLSSVALSSDQADSIIQEFAGRRAASAPQANMRANRFMLPGTQERRPPQETESVEGPAVRSRASRNSHGTIAPETDTSERHSHFLRQTEVLFVQQGRKRNAASRYVSARLSSLHPSREKFPEERSRI